MQRSVRRLIVSLRAILVIFAMLALAPIQPTRAQQSTQPLANVDCNGTYNQHFVSWMTYLLNPSANQPQRPDPQDPCYGALVQAQADALAMSLRAPATATPAVLVGQGGANNLGVGLVPSTLNSAPTPTPLPVTSGSRTDPIRAQLPITICKYYNNFSVQQMYGVYDRDHYVAIAAQVINKGSSARDVYSAAWLKDDSGIPYFSAEVENSSLYADLLHSWSPDVPVQDDSTPIPPGATANVLFLFGPVSDSATQLYLFANMWSCR